MTINLFLSKLLILFEIAYLTKKIPCFFFHPLSLYLYFLVYHLSFNCYLPTLLRLIHNHLNYILPRIEIVPFNSNRDVPHLRVDAHHLMSPACGTVGDYFIVAARRTFCYKLLCSYYYKYKLLKLYYKYKLLSYTHNSDPSRLSSIITLRTRIVILLIIP